MENKEIVIKPDFIEPIEINDYQEVKTNVNNARNNFLLAHENVVKKNKIVSGIFFAIALGVIVLGYVFEKMLGLAMGLVIGGSIALWLITRQFRKKIDNAVSDYLYAYSINCNSYMYKGEDFKEIKIGYKQHPDHELLKKFNICDDVTQIVSRELITGKMFDHDFIAADVSLKAGKSNRQKDLRALLVGKAFIFNYSFEEGRTFLYLKGCGDAAPTKLEDVNKVSVKKLKDSWEVYTSQKNYNKIFTDSFIKALNKLECDNTLNDVVISICDSHILVGFSYSDEAMVIPMREEYDTKHFEHKVEDLEILKLINKSLIENNDIKK